MLLGIDVGGTFTDAVFVDGGRVVASHKSRTTKEDLLQGITAALDGTLPSLGVTDYRDLFIERVTLSTTVITNTVVEYKEDPVDLYVITGPGRNVDDIFPVKPVCLDGYTDHRGIVAEPTPERSIPKERCGRSKHAAISAKFSVRNPDTELHVQRMLEKYYAGVSRAGALSGSLNFPRRTVSAYFNSAVIDVFQDFRSAVEQALAVRHIEAPLFILKADGGSLPIGLIGERPVETVFTGPAATVLGLYALGIMDDGACRDKVALDIGGTTTDISLWRDGKPLMTRDGVMIRDYPSAVRSFAVHSVGIGGESEVTVTSGGIQVGPERKGPSVALGGTIPTLGDALVVLGSADYGDRRRAENAMQDIRRAFLHRDISPRAGDTSADEGLSPVGEYDEIHNRLIAAGENITIQDIARAVAVKAVSTVWSGICSVVAVENQRPIYVVEDLIHNEPFRAEKLILVGGTASGLAGLTEEVLDIPTAYPENAAVANAIGAAVARHTVELTVHVDTKRRLLTVPELGIHKEDCTLRNGHAVRDYSVDLLRDEARRLGLDRMQNIEVVGYEDFPVVEGWRSQERLITVKVQLQAGVRTDVRG